MAGAGFLTGLVSLGGRPIQLSIGPDLRILGFTATVCVVTALLFGLAPALLAGRLDLTRSIHSGWQGRQGGRQLSGRALVSCQCAISLVLIAGAALLGTSLWNLRKLHPGFVAEDVATAELCVVPTRDGMQRLVRLADPLEARLRAMPGVRSAAVSTFPVLSRGWQSSKLLAPGRPPREGEAVHVNQVTAGFFETYRIGLVRGRTLAATDLPGAPKAAVINERLAEQYFGVENPVGRQVALDSPSDSWTIVGVVRNTKYHNLREDAPPQIYLPVGQANAPGIFIGVRTEPGASVTPRQIRAALAEVDSVAAIREHQTLKALMEATLERERLMAKLGLAFGGMALVLAICGVYATMAYSVARRTREIGLRMALGATPSAVRDTVLREALGPTLAGIMAGIPFAIGGAQALRSALYGITPANPAAVFGAALAILAASTLAAWLPAARAARVDPVKALACE
jgi:predicted permease